MSSHLKTGSEEGLRSRSSVRNDRTNISQTDHKIGNYSHNSHTWRWSATSARYKASSAQEQQYGLDTTKLYKNRLADLEALLLRA